MLIAIDYDATWTQDPPFWRQFCKMVVSRGHQVICVTNRTGDTADCIALAGVRRCVTEIIFAGPLPKRKAAHRRGKRPHVWIDDNPSTIDHGL